MAQLTLGDRTCGVIFVSGRIWMFFASSCASPRAKHVPIKESILVHDTSVTGWIDETLLWWASLQATRTCQLSAVWCAWRIYFLDLGTTSWFPKLSGKQVLIFKKRKFQFWNKQKQSYILSVSIVISWNSSLLVFQKPSMRIVFSFQQWNPNSIEGIYFLILCSGLEDVDWNWKNNQNNIVDIVAQIYD